MPCAMALSSRRSSSSWLRRLALEVLLHERLVGLGDQVGELLASGLGGGGELGGDVEDLLAVALVVIGLHADDVDDAAEVGLFTHGDLHGTHAVTELRVERRHDRREVRVLLVHPVDEHGARDSDSSGDPPETVSLDLGSGDGVDDEERHLGRFHAGDGVAYEVGIAGGVDDVDLDTVVNDGRQGEVDRELALDLFRIVVETGVSVVHGSQALGCAGQVEHRFGKRRLARTAVSDEYDVADFISTRCSQVHRLLG